MQSVIDNILIAEYAQKEYWRACALVFAMLFLGLLVVCIPRPRKSELNPKKKVKKKKTKKKKTKKKKKKAVKKS